MLEDVRAKGFPLPDGRMLIPEPVVKAMLADDGVLVPRSAGVEDAAGLAAVAVDLQAPLVLKAWADGLVHKSDVGAVRLGLDQDSLAGAAIEMEEALRTHGFVPAGFLVEEQQPRGLELIIGVVNRADFGPVVLLGVGGTMAEYVDQTVVRVCPLDEAAAWEMLDAFPGARLLDGVRGEMPVDRGAVVSLLVALAGRGGLVDRLGAALSEFECNPVIVTAKGAVAADARLILQEPVVEEALRAPAPTSFDRLFNPRSVAVAGASTSRVNFGNRFLRSYRALGWDQDLFAIHPTATEIDGVPAVPSVAALPGELDYLLVAVPAVSCAGLVRDSAGRVAFAQVMSGGFREASDDGRALESELRRAGREASVRIVGPNCMGIYSPAGRQTFQLGDPVEPGPVSIVSQSGGLAGDIIKAGAQRGLRFAKLATIGNAIDVSPGELVDYFIDDPATELIGLYLEGTSDGRGLLEALRRARGRKPVVLLIGGLSSQGSRAAASHTGSMTGDTKVWDAISVATNCTVVRTLEDLLGVLAFLERYAATEVPGDPSVLVVGPGGGASILSADASDRHDLLLEPVESDIQHSLRELGYGAGTSVANPIEIPVGPAAAVDAFDPILDAILPTQPFGDVIIHINVQSFYSHGDRGAQPLLDMLEHLASRSWATRLALTLRNVDCATPSDLVAIADTTRRLRIPYFRDFDAAMTAVDAAKRFARARWG